MTKVGRKNFSYQEKMQMRANGGHKPKQPTLASIIKPKEKAVAQAAKSQAEIAKEEQSFIKWALDENITKKEDLSVIEDMVKRSGTAQQREQFAELSERLTNGRARYIVPTPSAEQHAAKIADMQIALTDQALHGSKPNYAGLAESLVSQAPTAEQHAARFGEIQTAFVDQALHGSKPDYAKIANSLVTEAPSAEKHAARLADLESAFANKGHIIIDGAGMAGATGQASSAVEEASEATKSAGGILDKLKNIKLGKWGKIGLAAAGIGLLAAGGYMLYKHLSKKEETPVTETQDNTKIVPPTQDKKAEETKPAQPAEDKATTPTDTQQTYTYTIQEGESFRDLIKRILIKQHEGEEGYEPTSDEIDTGIEQFKAANGEQWKNVRGTDVVLVGEKVNIPADLGDKNNSAEQIEKWQRRVGLVA